MKELEIKESIKTEFNGQVSVSFENNCIVLTGELEDWNDVVKAGMMASTRYSKTHVVNKIRFTGDEIPAMRIPLIQDKSLDGKAVDVLVIGAGISGATIARELTKHKLSVLLIDKENDVAMHASSKNDGMVHVGADLKKGTLKKLYNAQGNQMYDRLSKELSFDFQRPGSYLAMTGQNPLLVWIYTLAARFNGIKGVKIVSKKKIFELQPAMNPKVNCAIFYPSAGIISPYNTVIAFAENAVQNGAELSLNTAVLEMEVKDQKIISVTTNCGKIFPKLVINAAGTFAEDIAIMAQDHFFSIHPRKGTNSILDKKARSYITMISSIFGMSQNSNNSKGGAIVLTVEGNVLVGPDAVDTYKKEDYSTDSDSMDRTFNKQLQTIPTLKREHIIAYFAGVRAPSYEEDFIVEKGRFTKNIIHSAGIQSPGLTAAPAIALAIEKIAIEMLSSEMTVEKNPNFNPHRDEIIKPVRLSIEERAALIKSNPNYGEIICRCEEISKQEVIDALHRPVPCNSMDGIKRRVRPGSGRCQGGFCGPLVAQIMAQEFNVPLNHINKSTLDSPVLCSPTKEEPHGKL